MRYLKAALLVSVVPLVAIPVAVGSQGAPLPQLARAEAQQAAPVYKPPLRGAPGGRVGGGTRGISRDTFVLSVLAPNHTGLTASEQPALYWFISKATTLPVEVTVTEADGADPALETRLTAPVSAGIQSIRLADHGVRLKPGVVYQWHVAVVADPNRRSRDILASGTIERVEAPEPLRTRVASAKPHELPAIYAEAGLWYDAVAAASDLIAAAPENAELRKHRTALLTQVGLVDVVVEP